MSRIVLTLDTEQFDACNGDFDQLVDDIQAFINILHHASPDYVEAGNILQKQLDEQVKKHKEESKDPVELMQKHLDNVAPDFIDGSDPDLNAIYCELRKCIGGAPMVVAYAAYKLARYIDEKHIADNKWIWDFVKYYEENWKVE